MTVVPIKFALGLQKFDFWAFQKNNHEWSLGYTWCDSFFNHPKINRPPMIRILEMRIRHGRQILECTSFKSFWYDNS